MLTVQIHDAQLRRAHTGSLMAHFGLRLGIDSIAQAERMLHGIRQDTWHRAYCILNGKPVVVWARTNDGNVQYVARSADYGDGQLPFLYPGIAGLVLGQMGVTVSLITEGAEWAASVLKGDTATAIIIDNEGVCAAWELGKEAPVMVACRA